MSTCRTASCCVLMLWSAFVFARPVQAAPKGAEHYVAGLLQMTDGKFADAAETFSKALEANDEDANYHVARALALLFNDASAAARPHLERAGRLAPRSPVVELWQYVVIYSFPRTRHEIPPRPPYESKEPQARAVIEAAFLLRTGNDEGKRQQSAEAWAKLKQLGVNWAWRELARPDLIEAQYGAIDALYARKEWAACLGLIERLLEGNPSNLKLISIGAGCKLALHDLAGARRTYSQGLAVAPMSAPLLLGRALTTARIGAVRTAEADFAAAKLLDGAMAGRYQAEFQRYIAAAGARLPTQRQGVLLAALRKAAADQPVEQLMPLAEGLIRADIAARLYPDEAFTQELVTRQHAVNTNPRDLAAARALVAFHIKPWADVPVVGANPPRTAKVPVGQPHLPRAHAAVTAALKAFPEDVELLTLQAKAHWLGGNYRAMLPIVETLLKQDKLNYDLASMYLDNYQRVAADLESQAAALRSPRTHYENRSDGRYRVTTYPSAADLARAAALEQQAREHRRRSMVPMQQFSKSAKGTPWGHLADAELYRMIGEWGRMVASAEAAFQVDPYHLEAREYLVFYCPKVGLNDKAVQHQDILDNLIAPSARIAIGPTWTLTEQTRYSSALERLDAGEAKEPASLRVPLWRSVVLTMAGKSAEADTAFRTGAAMLHAHHALQGQSLDPSATGRLQAEDAAMVMALHLAWARMHKAADASRAWEQLELLQRIAQRVPATQWNMQLQATALPTIFDAARDRRRVGLTVREMVIESYSDGGRLLLAMNRLEDSARQYIAWGELSKLENKGLPVAAAYPLYQKLGDARASRIFNAEWIQGLRINARLGRPQGDTFEGTETLGKEGDRAAWIDARVREIDLELANLARSQTLTAKRKTDELQAERHELLAEKASIKPD